MAIRLALAGDVKKIRALEKGSFPKGKLDLEPAHVGEIEYGVEKQQIWVEEVGADLVGFIHVEELKDRRYNLVSLAVKNDYKGRGFGRNLLAHVLALVFESEPQAEMSCVTSPRNIGMMRLLLSHQFVGTRIARDYYGKGKDRVFFRRGYSRGEYFRGSHEYIPMDSTDALIFAMENANKELVGVQSSAQGVMAELANPVASEPIALRQTEANASVSESSGVLAALVFLLGFSFAAEGDALPWLRVFLAIAAVLTLGSLQVYANSTGSMARIGDGKFDAYMKWGNLLLEYGGIYPLALSLPVMVAALSPLPGIGYVVVGFTTLLLFAYEFSPFSIYSRYRKSVTSTVLVLISCLLPAASSLLLYANSAGQGDKSAQGWWVLLASLVLLARFVWQARRGNDEGFYIPRRRSTAQG